MEELEEIKRKVLIADICLKNGIRLIKRGKNLVGLCPFHNEKTPSFTINTEENYYKCFGCQAGGDVIQFCKDLYRTDYGTAIRELKEMAGLGGTTSTARRERKYEGAFAPLPAPVKDKYASMSNDEKYLFDEVSGITGDEDEARRAVVLQRLERNKDIFFELWTYCLTNFNRDYLFRKYLIEERRLSERIIEKSDIFFIGDYYRVSNHLKKLFTIGDLQRSGLYNENGNLIFYNHKIIIPYKWKNEIVYLRGRLMGQGVRGGKQDLKWSKYLGLRNDELNLNTPKRFYNVDVIERLFPGEHIYITEGELDALMMEDLGYNALGIPGVGNTPSDYWLKRLFSNKVFLCVDQDEAGRKLEERLAGFYNEHHKTIYSKQLGAKDVTELVASMNN